MIVIVSTLTKKQLEIEIETTDTILWLKQKILEREGIPINQQRLIHRGRQLNDDRTLAEHAIERGAIIHLVYCLRGGGDGFEFASMEKMRPVELVKDGPNRLIIRKKGLFLSGICKNQACSIYDEIFVASIGMGTFDAQNLNDRCHCPECFRQTDHKHVGFYKCTFSVDGTTSQGQIKKFERNVTKCVIQPITPGETWSALTIHVEPLMTLSVQLDQDM